MVGREGEPLLLAGNECVGVADSAPLPMRVELWQDLSLPGQPRDRSRPLAEIIASEGIGAGSLVGIAGWKTYAERSWLEAPSFLADALRATVAPSGRVGNATDLFIDPAAGLRVSNEVDQLAAFEYAACHTSEGLKRLLFGLRPGMTEAEAAQLLRWNGAPLSCHLMLSSGPPDALEWATCLAEPAQPDRPRHRAWRHPFTVAFGIWGALDCRAGFGVEDARELPAAIDDYVDRLVAPYFEAIAEWVEALHVGQTGGALQAISDRHLGDPCFGIFLNPGHLIGLEEWVNTPVAPGSTVKLRSGMALQIDVIPATGTDYFTTNIEGGLALANEALRTDLAARHPEAWERIEARRIFMRESLGIDVPADVLPLSNLPAYLPPFLLRPERAMTLKTPRRM